MSGTPSIFEHYAILESPLGAPQPSRVRVPASLILLARGPWAFRASAIAEAGSWGFGEVLLVEDGLQSRDLSLLHSQYPWLRILVPSRWWNPGQRINTAAQEVRYSRFAVLWDDQKPAEPASWARSLLRSPDSPLVAIIPERRDRNGRDLPSVHVPGMERDRLKILSFGADQEVVDTLFPVDYCGLYDRGRFVATGGFDVSLTNPFWQCLDWGLRSRLWGERLCVERGLKLEYLAEHPLEDRTPDRSYPRFFLRNVAVRFAADHGYLPWTRLGTHIRRSGLSIVAGLKSFLADRDWVHKHRYRFHADARLLVEMWGAP